MVDRFDSNYTSDNLYLIQTTLYLFQTTLVIYAQHRKVHITSVKSLPPAGAGALIGIESVDKPEYLC